MTVQATVMQAHAKITKDHIGHDSYSDAGKVINLPWRMGFGHPFKLYDDDNELYYSGEIFVHDDDVDDAALDLQQWGEAYAGATSIEIDGDRPFG